MGHLIEILFSVKGRLGRLKYFLYGLIPNIILLLITYIGKDQEYIDHLPPFMQAFLLLLVLLCLYSLVVLMIKRFHDFNYPGWWVLLCLIPFLNFVIGLILLFLPGTVGPNRFGIPSD